ncbi:MAG: barstar family protein [Burkholderiales bacterium]|nr:barstar family protein [Burkholderiales bacterium]
MGKLAERLSDFTRSGVYRIETCEAVEEAAALNSFALVRVTLDRVATETALVETVVRAAAFPGRFGNDGETVARGLIDLSWTPAPGYVFLVSGFRDLQRTVPECFSDFLGVLDAAAANWRERGRSFFAAFVDPSGHTPLAPLYHWRKRGE